MSQYKVIVEGKRYETNKMKQVIDEQRKEGHGTGISLCGVWITKSNKVLVITDSIWASSRNDGTCVGIRAHFADDEEIASLADEYGGELENLVPIGE